MMPLMTPKISQFLFLKMRCDVRFWPLADPQPTSSCSWPKADMSGVAGGGRGAAIGAGVGAATGAIIAAEGQRRRGGYFWWRGAVTWNGLAAGFGFPRIIADKSLVQLH